MFANEFFAHRPKRLRVLRIDRVRPHPTLSPEVFDHLSDVAVFAIAAADFIRRCDDASPYGGCGSLGHALQKEWRCPLGPSGSN